MGNPLISIGLLTYNRPAGLKKAIEHILRQTFVNFELIISDNCSSSKFKEEYDQVLCSFDDNRIKYFKQDINLGVNRNFKFVLEQARGEYFIWAADDDLMLSENLLEKLLNKIQEGYQLVFPNFNVDGKDEDHLTKVYNNATDRFSYLKAWCTDLIGFPMYGLYNKKFLIANNYNLLLDTDYYFVDSIFLHKIFLTADVSYLRESFIYYAKSNSFNTFSNYFMIKSFLRMIKIITPFFYKSKLTVKQHLTIALLLLPNYIMYISRLCITLIIRFILSQFGYAIKRDDNNKLKVVKEIKLAK